MVGDGVFWSTTNVYPPPDTDHDIRHYVKLHHAHVGRIYGGLLELKGQPYLDLIGLLGRRHCRIIRQRPLLSDPGVDLYQRPTAKKNPAGRHRKVTILR